MFLIFLLQFLGPTFLDMKKNNKIEEEIDCGSKPGILLLVLLATFKSWVNGLMS
jgi:hypothetical protein